jgi:hypothetical protein
MAQRDRESQPPLPLRGVSRREEKRRFYLVEMCLLLGIYSLLWGELKGSKPQWKE